jgi:hypothetical protein
MCRRCDNGEKTDSWNQGEAYLFENTLQQGNGK